VLLLAACSKQPDTKAEQKNEAGGLQTVVMASTGSDADIWRFIATLPETKAAGIKLEVKNFTDYVAMNTAVANKEVDVNAFQSYAYLVAFNASNQDKIAPVSTTYLEPMGIYSSKVKKLKSLLKVLQSQFQTMRKRSSCVIVITKCWFDQIKS
jgi:D-methionine transport system substrate-binding protein